MLVQTIGTLCSKKINKMLGQKYVRKYIFNYKMKYIYQEKGRKSGKVQLSSPQFSVNK